MIIITFTDFQMTQAPHM